VEIRGFGGFLWEARKKRISEEEAEIVKKRRNSRNGRFSPEAGKERHFLRKTAEVVKIRGNSQILRFSVGSVPETGFREEEAEFDE
jgi:hypothetical protein